MELIWRFCLSLIGMAVILFVCSIVIVTIQSLTIQLSENHLKHKYYKTVTKALITNEKNNFIAQKRD